MRTRLRAVLALTSILGLLLGLLALAPAEARSARPHRPPRPAVTKVKPSTEPATGGTTVTIKGKNLAKATRVLFGTARGTALTVRSSHKLTVVAPAHAPGTVDVRVVTKRGTSKKSAKDRFTYTAVGTGPTTPTPTITVTGVSPATGSYAGGAPVTVTGTGFTAGAAVTLGGAPATGVTVLSPTQLTLTTPAHAVGPVDVRVAVAAVTSAVTAGDVFTYALVPNAVDAPLPPGAPAASIVSLKAVDCPATSSCTAVGSYTRTDGTRVPLVEHLAGTTWTPSSPPLPPGAGTDPDSGFTAVDCPSATFCVAVGGFKNATTYFPLVETWNGTTWAVATLPNILVTAPGLKDPLKSVSCASTTLCAASGELSGPAGDLPVVYALVGTSWTNDTTNLPVDGLSGDLFDVTCASSDCFAVGSYATPASAQKPVIVTFDSGAWTAVAGPLPPMPASNPGASLRSISCTSGTGCVAVGDYTSAATGGPHLGYASTLSGGTWTAANTVTPTGAPIQPDISLNSVSCAAATYCFYGGSVTIAGHVQALQGRIRNGLDQSATVSLPHPGTDPAANLTRVACPVAQGCVAIGGYTSTTGLRTGLLLQVSGSQRPTQDAPGVPAGDQVQLTDVDPDTSVTGVAVGGYFGAAPGTHGLLLTGVPVGPTGPES